MSKPVALEEFRYVGDKRTQIVYDMDEMTSNDHVAQAVADLVVTQDFSALRPGHARRSPQIVATGRIATVSVRRCGQCLAYAFEPRLERGVGERGLARQRERIVG